MINGELVSIIIPVFNRADLIGETLNSILCQTYKNWECIVVDDGSTDNTEEIVRKYIDKDKRIQFYKRPKTKPKGANACRNYGFELSKGTYVNWFDSDDIMHAEKLENQVLALDSTLYPFSICQSLIFEGTIDNIIGVKSKMIKSDKPLDDFLTKKMVWLTQAPLFRKDFLMEHKYFFDEELQAGQEWELFTRILIKFRDYHVVNTPLVYLRQHENSLSNNIGAKNLWNYFLGRYKIYKQFGNQLSLENRNYLKRYFLLIYKILLRKFEFKKAWSVYRLSLLTDNSLLFKQHLFLILSFFSFMFFKKGDVFLTKVHLWNE